MSAKTDLFLPRADLLTISRDNLEVFAQADVFLLCQTRSPAAVEDEAIFAQLCRMADRGKIGVSFSISTDIKEEQRRIESGGLSPERRIQTMRRLKEAGVFVSAAVSPVMPFSGEFAHLLLDSVNHGFDPGSATWAGWLCHSKASVDRGTSYDS